MSLTTALLFGAAMPTLSGTERRHLMDDRPVSGHNYCREHNAQMRLANIETIFAAVTAGFRQVCEIEAHTRIGRCTIAKALAELESDKRVQRRKLGKQTFFEVLK